MKSLFQTNPYLRDLQSYKKNLHRNIKSSNAIEGIREYNPDIGRLDDALPAPQSSKEPHPPILVKLPHGLTNMGVFLAFFLLTGFSGCQTKPDNPPNTVTVEIPVTVLCVTDIPLAPKFVTDEELGKMSDGQFVTSLHVDRLQRKSYEALLLGVLEACK